MARPSDEAVFEFACFKVRSTDKAVLVVEEATGTSHWIPKSQIVREDLFEDGNPQVAGILTVTEWIAREKKLIPLEASKPSTSLELSKALFPGIVAEYNRVYDTPLGYKDLFEEK